MTTHHPAQANDYLLAYAPVGKADYLVTGDEDLLEPERVDTLKIVTAREFLTMLATAQPDLPQVAE